VTGKLGVPMAGGAGQRQEGLQPTGLLIGEGGGHLLELEIFLWILFIDFIINVCLLIFRLYALTGKRAKVRQQIIGILGRRDRLAVSGELAILMKSLSGFSKNLRVVEAVRESGLAPGSPGPGGRPLSSGACRSPRACRTFLEIWPKAARLSSTQSAVLSPWPWGSYASLSPIFKVPDGCQPWRPPPATL
jgi:hypothetical protein